MNDATVYTKWGKQLNTDMFQVSFGDQRTIIVNSWATMKDLWVTRSNDLIDRPHQPGFLDKLGVDITGSPMTDQIRRCRVAAMKALGKVSTSTTLSVFILTTSSAYVAQILPSCRAFIRGLHFQRL